jgi:hypothetical protein
MSRKQKVYGFNFDGKERRIVAATSFVEAAKLAGSTVARVRKYGCVTGNTVEISIAMSTPGKAWRLSNKVGSNWEIIV